MYLLICSECFRICSTRPENFTRHRKDHLFRKDLGFRSQAMGVQTQGCPQVIAHSNCAINSNKLRYLLFQNYWRIIVI